MMEAANRKYDAMIGTGGIGTGTFFVLRGNHTLGREESRGGKFLDRRDYCKLHIICHYVQRLMGESFTTLPVGYVGDDPPGQTVLREMKQAGLNLRHVHALGGEATLQSICLIYPDGSGGNLTTDDSACASVSAETIRQAEVDFAAFEGRGIALAAPEVPLEARHELLRLATRYRFLRAASLTSAEMLPAMECGMLSMVDLLAINIDEAAAILPEGSAPADSEATVKAGVQTLLGLQPEMRVCVTAGNKGSWTWDGQDIHHHPSCPVQTANSAGAGDAFFAGILCGLTGGLSLKHAQQLATLTAAMSVTSEHTIHEGISRATLREFARQVNIVLDESVAEVLEP